MRTRIQRKVRRAVVTSSAGDGSVVLLTGGGSAVAVVRSGQRVERCRPQQDVLMMRATPQG